MRDKMLDYAEFKPVIENLTKCPHCNVRIRKRKRKEWLMCRGKKMGKGFYITEEKCPKCDKSKDVLIRELIIQREKEIEYCPDCKTKMTKCQYRLDLMKGFKDGKCEFVITMFVSNQSLRCKKCGFVRKARFGTNLMLYDLKYNRCSVNKYFPSGPTFTREVWTDIK